MSLVKNNCRLNIIIFLLVWITNLFSSGESAGKMLYFFMFIGAFFVPFALFVRSFFVKEKNARVEITISIIFNLIAVGINFLILNINIPDITPNLYVVCNYITPILLLVLFCGLSIYRIFIEDESPTAEDSDINTSASRAFPVWVWVLIGLIIICPTVLYLYRHFN
jgi:hypothetical protein